MLRISNLTLARGTKRLLEGANLTVHAGHKVGLVGANGCGKSSLFAAVRQRAPSRRRTIDAAAGVDDRARRAGDARRRDAGHRIRARRRPRTARDRSRAGRRGTRPAHGGEALAELHHRFDDIGGYSSRARAATLLAGLGFTEARHGDPVASFSGGWRMRLNLAQALMCRSDLLLLDEPTNHLDLDAVLWLEDWLGSIRARCSSSRTIAISSTASSARSSMSTRAS